MLEEDEEHVVVVLAVARLARGIFQSPLNVCVSRESLCQQNGCVWTGQPGQCNKEVPSGVLSTSEQLSEVVYVCWHLQLWDHPENVLGTGKQLTYSHLFSFFSPWGPGRAQAYTEKGLRLPLHCLCCNGRPTARQAQDIQGQLVAQATRGATVLWWYYGKQSSSLWGQLCLGPHESLAKIHPGEWKPHQLF